MTRTDTNPSGTALKDARLDIILTNMKYTNAEILEEIGDTEIRFLSDHYPITVELNQTNSVSGILGGRKKTKKRKYRRSLNRR